jgi:hypothetical protein
LADYRKALEYDRSNITPRFHDGDKKTIFAMTLSEKGSPDEKDATTKSRAI